MYYPLFLDLAGRPVVVVGAGAVAARKIRSLRQAGARITVISPTATAAVTRAKRVRWLRRVYRAGDLRGAALAVAATDDPAVNRRVCAEAQRRGVLVNCITPPAAGSFLVPAVVRAGRITLAISTGGLSPAFAKRLRVDLEKFLGAGYPALLKRMAAERNTRARERQNHRTR